MDCSCNFHVKDVVNRRYHTKGLIMMPYVGQIDNNQREA